MNYRKVNQGDDLAIPAAVWNGLQDLLAASRGSGPPPPRVPRSAAQRNSGVVLVGNATGSALEPYRAVALEQPLVTPGANEQEFLRRIALKGIVPTSAYTEDGRWAIVQVGLPAGTIGEAVVSGITIARVNVTAAADKFVQVSAGTTLLASATNATNGTGQLIWVAGGVGTATGTGEQWAIVRLGGGVGEATELPNGTARFQVLTWDTNGSPGTWYADWPRAHA